jgi:outer membrane protein TolC
MQRYPAHAPARAFRRALLAVLIGLLLFSLLPHPASAQPDANASDPITITLAEAVDVALTQSYALKNSRLDVENAEARIREAWGSVLPSVDASAGYTRNVRSANPFAGSDAGNLLGGGTPTDWLGYNERRRQDGDPSTNGIPLSQFLERQQEGREAAGFEPGGGGGNPFSVPNQFQGGLQVRQALYNGQAFAAIEGAQVLEDVNELGLERRQETLIRDVRQAYYQTLLAQQQVRVNRESVDRAQATLDDIALQVKQGVAPKMERLSAEVRLANARTQLTQTANRASTAKDNLKMAMGLEVEQPITLAGELEVENPGLLLASTSREGAVEIAYENRADLAQAEQSIELNRVQQNVTEAQYWPTVSAVANFNYSGRVPDNRTSYRNPNPRDPFTFTENTEGFFSSSYWNPSVSVGLQMSWNLFNGFQTTARVQQDQIAIERAQTQYEQLRERVRLQVESALRDVQSARSRLGSQAQNVETARTNYEFAQKRLSVGESGQLRVREASQQLDTAQLNYLQAAHDYLSARAALQTAMGTPLSVPGDTDFNLTSN